MADRDAHPFLYSILGRQLRITTTDTRMFVGRMKCTDKDQNIILSTTFEHRHPSNEEIELAAAAAKPTSSQHEGSIKLDMTSRYLGLVVVPGEFISKIEVEEEAPV